MKKIILMMFVFSCQNLFADESSQKALIETQKLLKDPNRAQSEAFTSPSAKNTDRTVTITTLGKPELKQQMYEISAELMAWLVEQTKGDPAKMQEFVAEAQSNPQAFLERMPASERAKVKSLSESIDASRTKNKTP